MTLNKPYWYWSEALKGTAPTAIVDQPEAGFWRLKRNGKWLPVAVYPLNGALAFKIGGQPVTPNVGTEQWNRYCANPITEDEYRKVAEHGGDWSDADPTVAAMISGAVKESTRMADVAAIQSNIANEPALIDKPSPDPTAEFREQIEIAKAGVASYSKIETDEASTRAASLRNMLLKLAKDSDTAREAEKAPHLKAGRDIDAKWQPLVRDANAAAQMIRKAMEVWEDDKREAARKAAARAVEEAAAQRVASPAPTGQPAPAPAPVASNLPAPQQQVKPTFGKAASVGSRMEVTAVDIDKFVAALRPRPEWKTVEAQFLEWAQKLANRGIILDGVTAVEKSQIR